MIELIYDIKKGDFVTNSDFMGRIDFEASYTYDFPEIDYRARFEEVLFFDTEDFHSYHEKNVSKVYRLTFVEGENPIAFCYIGEKYDAKEKILCIPYSAPFSKVYFSKKSKTEDRVKVYREFKKVSEKMGGSLRIILPPELYYNDFSIDIASFMDSGLKIKYTHINNYFDLREINDFEGFVDNRSHSYRKNLKKGKEKGLLIDINEKDSLVRAYNVIEKNRSEKGYPLSMTFDQVKDISKMSSSKVDSFVLYTLDNELREDIASGIVFKVNDRSVQVVYWGSTEKHSKMRPMELLSLEIIRYYKDLGISFVDIGPSTANDKISHGLYGFKVNIGCKSNLKMVIVNK